ncbi:MHS family MFS transporter [Saccharopolyspora erythraea]|uniref:MFS transporter n=1 Tax=Saccharopolyspora erythraea TaxID=1836 RepID=UPI001BAD3E2A|nr:MFS transporter [Saccharopolyspora erythraea]QUH01906.1 MHS family MFS transporter [Saccharopolyspora erythraea]
MSVQSNRARQRTKAVVASWVGTTIELYDNAAYGLAASLIFAPLFFPSTEPLVGTILSLSSFAVGFVARPLGAVVFGHFGDRVGRKTTLIVTLIMMGTATCAIGLLPTYDQVGLLAPVLLVICRILQGISVGGEYGGAVLMTVEHAGSHWRSFFGSLVNTGTTAGLLLANLAFLPVFSLPREDMLGWAWRIPFLISAVLVVVGYFVRSAVEESPDFARVKESGGVASRPIEQLLRHNGHTVLLLAFAILAAGVSFTMATVYSLTYGPTGLGLGNDTMLAVLLPATVIILLAIPVFGALADRVGVRRVFLISAASLVVLPFAWFALLETRQYWLMLLGFALLFIGYSANYAVVPAYFAQAFPPALRYTGMSIGFTSGLILGNAFAPTIATTLFNATGSWYSLAVYMGGTALISLIAGAFLRYSDADADATAAVATTAP